MKSLYESAGSKHLSAAAISMDAALALVIIRQSKKRLTSPQLQLLQSLGESLICLAGAPLGPVKSNILIIRDRKIIENIGKGILWAVKNRR